MAIVINFNKLGKGGSAPNTGHTFPHGLTVSVTSIYILPHSQLVTMVTMGIGSDRMRTSL